MTEVILVGKRDVQIRCVQASSLVQGPRERERESSYIYIYIFKFSFHLKKKKKKTLNRLQAPPAFWKSLFKF